MIFKTTTKIKPLFFSKFSLYRSKVFFNNSFYVSNSLYNSKKLINSKIKNNCNLFLFYCLRYYLLNFIFPILSSGITFPVYKILSNHKFKKVNLFLRNNMFVARFYSLNLRLLKKFYTKRAFAHYAYFGRRYRMKNFQKALYSSKAFYFYYRRKYSRLNPGRYNYFRLRKLGILKRRYRRVYFYRFKKKYNDFYKKYFFLFTQKTRFFYFFRKSNFLKKKKYLKQFNLFFKPLLSFNRFNFWETTNFLKKKKNFPIFRLLNNNKKKIKYKLKKIKAYIKQKTKKKHILLVFLKKKFNIKRLRKIFWNRIFKLFLKKKKLLFLIEKIQKSFFFIQKKKTRFFRKSYFFKRFKRRKVIKQIRSLNQNLKKRKLKIFKSQKNNFLSFFTKTFLFLHLHPFLYFLRKNKYCVKFNFKTAHRRIFFKQNYFTYLPFINYRRIKFLSRAKRSFAELKLRSKITKRFSYKFAYKQYFMLTLVAFVKRLLHRAQHYRFRKKLSQFQQLVRRLNRILRKQVNLRFFYKHRTIQTKLKYLFRVKRARRLKYLLTLKFKLQFFFTTFYNFKTNRHFFHFLRVQQYKLSKLITHEFSKINVFQKQIKKNKKINFLIRNFYQKTFNSQYKFYQKNWAKKKNRSFYLSYKLLKLAQRFTPIEKHPNMFFFFFKKLHLYQTFLLLEAQAGILLYRLRFIPFLTLIPKLFFYNLVMLNNSIIRNPFFIVTLYDLLSVPVILTKKLIFYHFNTKRQPHLTKKLKVFFKTLSTVYNPFLQKIWLPYYLTSSLLLGSAILHSVPNIYFFLQPFNRFNQTNSRTPLSYLRGSLKTTKILKTRKRSNFQRNKKFHFSQHFSRNFCLVRLNFFSYLNYYTKK